MAGKNKVQGHGRLFCTHRFTYVTKDYIYYYFCDIHLFWNSTIQFETNILQYSRTVAYETSLNIFYHKACQNTVEPNQLRLLREQPLWLSTQSTLFFFFIVSFLLGISRKTWLVWNASWNECLCNTRHTVVSGENITLWSILVIWKFRIVSWCEPKYSQVLTLAVSFTVFFMI